MLARSVKSEYSASPPSKFLQCLLTVILQPMMIISGMLSNDRINWNNVCYKGKQHGNARCEHHTHHTQGVALPFDIHVVKVDDADSKCIKDHS